MKKSILIYPLFLLITVLGFSGAATAQSQDELDRLERRLTTLEREAAAIRSELDDLRSQSEDYGTSPVELEVAPGLPGVWECTNGVYTYEVALMEDGSSVIKEMSLGQTTRGKWTAVGDDMVISGGGYRSGGGAKSWRIIEVAGDRMTLEEPNTRGTYDCYRR